MSNTPEQKPTMEDVLNSNLTYGADTYDAGQRQNILAAMKEWEQISMKERDLIIQGLEEGSAQWEQEYKDCRKILEALVELKNHKDLYGKTEEYEKQQPLTWEIAKRFLSKYQHY